MTLRHLALLTPGSYADEDPRPGLEDALHLFETAEALGLDSAWVRQRHLERGVSSAATFLAAATQRTRRIGLGVAVIQLGYENLFRLAEDLSTVDVLSGARLQVGLSAGPPPYGALLGPRLFDGDPARVDFSLQRAQRLRDNLGGAFWSDEAVIDSAAGAQRARLRPHAAGLAQRLWYGAGSLGSADGAGQAGFHLLLGNVTRAEENEDFLATQSAQLGRYVSAWDRAGHAGVPRVALGRVIVPTDNADAATRRRYEAFAASRSDRTRQPNGLRRTMFAPDLVGPSAQIVEQLRADPVLQRVSELRVELPYDFSRQDHEQILHDVVHHVAPALGWRPAAAGR